MAKNKRRKLVTIDCETDPFLHGRFPEPFVWGFYDGQNFSVFTETERLVEYLRNSEFLVYAHNGGRFDFFYLADYFEMFKKVRCINGRLVSIPFGKSTLRDSYSIIPTPLAAYKKDEFEYWKLERANRKKYWDEIIKYLKADCVYLYEYVTAFTSRYGRKLTLASAAMSQFQSMITKQERKELVSDKTYYEKFYPWYFGGRVECFKTGLFEKTTYIYDINSAYPYAMLQKHPIGMDYEFTDFDRRRHKIVAEDFYTVTGASHGAFPMRGLNLSFPNNDTIHTFNVTGHELIAGLDTDTFKLVKIHSRVHWSKHISFDQYVNYYYKQKVESPKDSTEYIFAKLMLNSLYGKFAANPNKYYDWIVIPHKYVANAIRVKDWDYGGKIGKDTALMMCPLSEEQKRFYNIATAASITGFVRAYLWKSICSVKGTVYYCDTDSMITDTELPTSKELGQWKLEQTNDKLAIVAPKLYGARNIKTGTWDKIASKGIKIDGNDLLALVKGKTFRYKRDAPTYSILQEPKFVTRVIKPLPSIVTTS